MRFTGGACLGYQWLEAFFLPLFFVPADMEKRLLRQMTKMAPTHRISCSHNPAFSLLMCNFWQSLCKNFFMGMAPFCAVRPLGGPQRRCLTFFQYSIGMDNHQESGQKNRLRKEKNLNRNRTGDVSREFRES